MASLVNSMLWMVVLLASLQLILKDVAAANEMVHDQFGDVEESMLNSKSKLNPPVRITKDSMLNAKRKDIPKGSFEDAKHLIGHIDFGGGYPRVGGYHGDGGYYGGGGDFGSGYPGVGGGYYGGGYPGGDGYHGGGYPRAGGYYGGGRRGGGYHGEHRCGHYGC